LRELAKASVELVRLVATNPNADPELLRKLGSSSDQTTREGVASNPNTPSDILLKLGAQFPGQLLDNPIFPLLLLENPNLLADMPVETLRSVLKREAVPISFLEWAANDSDCGVLLAVAMNPNTPKEVLEKLVRSRHSLVAESAQLHVNWVGEITENWEKIAVKAIKTTEFKKDSDYLEELEELAAIGAIPTFIIKQLGQNRTQKFRKVLARSGNAPANLLERLSDNNLCTEIRAYLASNPQTPLSIIEKLAKDNNEQVRVGIAQNPNTPASILERLAKETSFDIRQAIAQNPNTPAKLVAYLQYLQVARNAAENPNTPPDELEVLASHDSNWILEAVAANPSTPISVLQQLLSTNPEISQILQTVVRDSTTPLSRLEQLADMEDNNICSGIATNPNMPMHLKVELAWSKSASESVCLAFASNPNTPVGILKLIVEQSHSGRFLALSNPNMPVSILEQWARNENAEICLAIAQNPNTPGKLLEQLAKNSNYRVQQAVAYHPNTPVKVLEQFTDEFGSLWYAAASNPNLPVSILERLAENTPPRGKYPDFQTRVYIIAGNPSTRASILERLAQNKDLKVRSAVARNPSTPASSLELLAQQGDYICYLLANNPSTPASLLKRFAECQSETIRSSVATNRNMPASILEQLAGDVCKEVRLAVAQNPNSPVSILEKLAGDTSSDVRLAVAQNSNTPQLVLKQVKAARQAAENPQTPPEQLKLLVNSQWDWIHEAVASNPSTPVRVLEQLVADKTLWVEEVLARFNNNAYYYSPTPGGGMGGLTLDRLFNIRQVMKALAENPNTPVTSLEKLLELKEYTLLLEICLGIANCPKTPVSFLEQLAKSEMAAVRLAIAKNPNTPVSILEQLAGDREASVRRVAINKYLYQCPEGLPAVLANYARSDNSSFSRLIVLLHSQAPTELLAKNVCSSWWLERYAIAQNPNTSADTLKFLAQDGNRIVRAAAKDNLQQRS
jgi:hypothetical protein